MDGYNLKLQNKGFAGILPSPRKQCWAGASGHGTSRPQGGRAQGGRAQRADGLIKEELEAAQCFGLSLFQHTPLRSQSSRTAFIIILHD